MNCWRGWSRGDCRDRPPWRSGCLQSALNLAGGHRGRPLQRVLLIVLANQPLPFALHDIGERELELLLLLVDGAVELRDEPFIVVGELLFERFADRVTERADERAIELADAA